MQNLGLGDSDPPVLEDPGGARGKLGLSERICVFSVRCGTCGFGGSSFFNGRVKRPFSEGILRLCILR